MSALTKNLRVLGPALLVFGAAWLGVALGLDWFAQPSALGELIVQVRDDSGGALAEVAVLTDDALLGVSDAQGKLRVARKMRGVLHVEVRCPEAYRAAAAQRFDPGSSRSGLLFVCRPKLRTLALVVHAPAAAGQLVRAGAQSLGRVDAQGLLHAVLRRPPGSTLALSLVARAEDEGALSASTKTLVVEDRDRIVLFDPTLPSR
jgi:hypothetical protein